MDCRPNLLCFKTAYHRHVYSKHVQASKIKRGWGHCLFQHETVRGVRQNVTRTSILLTKQKCEVQNVHSYLDFVRRDLHNELRSVDAFTMISISTVTRHRSVSGTSRTRRLFSEAAWPVFKSVETISTYQTAEGTNSPSSTHRVPPLYGKFIKFSKNPATGPYPEPDNSHKPSLLRSFKLPNCSCPSISRINISVVWLQSLPRLDRGSNGPFSQ